MTSAAESTPDDQDRAANRASMLSTTDGAEAFLPGPDAPAAARSVGAWLLDYSAHAAMIVGLVGFAWTVSNHVVNRPGTPAAHAAVPTPKVDELADLRHANAQMAEDLHRLHASLDQLSSTVRDDKTSVKVRVLQAGLENVQNGLNAARGEATAAVAQISSKLEKVEHEPASKLQQLNERVGKLERTTVDPAPTGSLAPRTAALPASAAVPTPPAKPAPARVASLEEPRKDAHRAEDARAANEARATEGKAETKAGDGRAPAEAKAVDAKPPVLPGYVVRDVYDGVAIIEGRRGPIEVVPGVSIPGAGVVKSIDRRGSGWTVTTTKGLLAYAAPPRDYRRAGRGFYPPYRADF